VTVVKPSEISNGKPFIYLDPEITVTNISQSIGPDFGGTEVSIFGLGFTPDTQVMFGSNPATSTFLTYSQIDAISPPGVGTVDITFNVPTTNVPKQFIYQGLPILDFLDPEMGPSSGGTVVTLYGQHLNNTLLGKFDNQSAPFTVISDVQIEIVTPPRTGISQVRVTTPAGDSNFLQFAFILPCIASYTSILMADGSSREIQSLVRGDLVAGDPDLKTKYAVTRVLTDQLNKHSPVDIVTFQPHSLGPNKPYKKLIITANHAVLWEQARRPSKCFINYSNVRRENLPPNFILPIDERGHYCVHDLQFETLGSYVANGITVQSRSPRSNLTPLPKELYFNQELYTPDLDIDDPQYEYPLDMTIL